MPQISGLEPDEELALSELYKQWRAKLPRNELRSTYYHMRNVLKDLEISIPPHMKSVETVFGWAARSVDMLASRIRLDGFVLPDGTSDGDSFGIDALFRDNRLVVESPQAVRSALTHSTAFLTATKGDTDAGEPEVLIMARSARSATGIWSPRTRQLSSAMAITDSDAYGLSEFTLYLPDKVVTCRRSSVSKWDVRRVEHSLGRVPVEPLVYRPDLDRPFGKSRISRASMSIIDSAVRTALRTEVSAEFFAAPQRYMLGVDPSAFAGEDGATRTGWESIIGRMLAIGRDEDGEMPQVGTFAQQSMEPHFGQLRQLATRFAGEANIPVGALGVVHDANPTSSDSKEVDEADMIVDAEDAQDVFGFAWVQTMRNAVMMLDENDGASPPDLSELAANWRPAKTPSRAAAADATVKLVQSFPWLAETEVALEWAGFDRTTIKRLMAEKRRAGVSQFVASLAARQGAAPGAEQAPPSEKPEPAKEPAKSDDTKSATEDAAALKAKFEALGMAVRAGVDPADAASRLGLSGVKFTGGVPVSLRMPGQEE